MPIPPSGVPQMASKISEHERQHMAQEAPIEFDPLCWRCQYEKITREVGGEG